MSLQVGLHHPKSALFVCGPDFGSTIQFTDAGGQSIILFLPYADREAVRCMAEYFNDCIAPRPQPAPINPEDDGRGLELDALKFWNAAKFSRRAPDRDQTSALKVLRHVSRSNFKQLRDRANDILKGLPNEPSPIDRG